MILDRSIINFLGGGVVAQVLHRLHDQLTLFGISHIVLLFLCFWVLGVRRGSDVLFALDLCPVGTGRLLIFVIAKGVIFHVREGDDHYDIVSAYQKSMARYGPPAHPQWPR